MKKPKKALDGMHCCSCASGVFHLKKVDYKTKVECFDVLVKGLWLEVCDVCGEMLFSSDAGREIEKEILKVFPNYYKRVQKQRKQLREIESKKNV